MANARRGDRSSLTSAELAILEEKTIPEARAFLRSPLTAYLGASTLLYWGEPIVDVTGEPYDLEGHD